MRLPPSRTRLPHEPIGPLVDVVFLLLVFFLLAGTLDPARPIQVDPPESEHADRPKSDGLRVLVDAKGRIGFEGKVLDTEALAATIAERMDADSPRLVEVEADDDAAAGQVLALLKQLRSTGVEELELVTRPVRVAPGGDG